MTKFSKCFIGSYVKNGDSVKQRNSIYTSQRKVLEYEDCKILQDFPTQTDKTIEHDRPDITVIDQKRKECVQIDSACPFDTCIERSEEEKCTDYSELKYEIAEIWKVIKVEVILVIRSNEAVIKQSEKWIEKLDSNLTIEALEKTCLLGTSRIIWKVLNVK